MAVVCATWPSPDSCSLLSLVPPPHTHPHTLFTPPPHTHPHTPSPPPTGCTSACPLACFLFLSILFSVVRCTLTSSPPLPHTHSTPQVIHRPVLWPVGAGFPAAGAVQLCALTSSRPAVPSPPTHPTHTCRLYIGLSFGLLEPAFLLLVLFSVYTVAKHQDEPGSNPNLFIFALTVGLTLPMCAAQVFAALFSRWVVGGWLWGRGIMSGSVGRGEKGPHAAPCARRRCLRRFFGVFQALPRHPSPHRTHPV